jgi:hypothetical protein
MHKFHVLETDNFMPVHTNGFFFGGAEFLHPVTKEKRSQCNIHDGFCLEGEKKEPKSSHYEDF